MTYLVGWASNSHAYLFADTALTRPSNLGDQYIAEWSSFGERRVDDGDVHVGEGAIKLVHLDRAIVGICGRYAVAQAVLTAFSSELDRDTNVKDALENALARALPCADPDHEIHLIIAAPADERPVLLAFNIDGDNEIHEIPDDHLVQFGSISPLHKGLTPELFKMLTPFSAEPRRQLACALTILQNYGANEYLLETGVGGAFCGAYISTDSIKWQEDILYCIWRPGDTELQMISCIIRDHVLVVRSNITNSCRYFGNSLTGALNDNWRQCWWESAFEFTASGRFQFVSFLTVASHISTVVEMLTHHNSKHLRISVASPESADEEFRLNFAMSPLLIKAMNEPIPGRDDGSLPIKLNWFPYEQPTLSADQ